jgi:hypothetical protein
VSKDDAGMGDWETHEAELLDTAEEWVTNMKSEGQKLADIKGNEAEGPGQQFFEKLAELSLFFDDKTLFGLPHRLLARARSAMSAGYKEAQGRGWMRRQ